MYLAIYLFANAVLALTTVYAIPFWEPYYGFEKLVYVISLFAAALLISAISPLIAILIPLVLFYYAVQPFSEMLLLTLTMAGYPPLIALIITSLAWFPAAFEVFIAWGLGVLAGSVVGLKAFPQVHKIYGKLFKRFAGVI